MIMSVGDDEVILNSSLVVGEQAEGPAVQAQPPRVRHRQAFDEVEACLNHSSCAQIIIS